MIFDMEGSQSESTSLLKSQLYKHCTVGSQPKITGKMHWGIFHQVAAQPPSPAGQTNLCKMRGGGCTILVSHILHSQVMRWNWEACIMCNRNSMCKRGGTSGSGARTWLNGWFNIFFPWVGRASNLLQSEFSLSVKPLVIWKNNAIEPCLKDWHQIPNASWVFNSNRVSNARSSIAVRVWNASQMTREGACHFNCISEGSNSDGLILPNDGRLDRKIELVKSFCCHLIRYTNRQPNRWCEPYSPEQNYVLEGLVYGKVYGMCDNTFSGPGINFTA